MLRKETDTCTTNEKPSADLNAPCSIRKLCHILTFVTIMLFYTGFFSFFETETANAEELYGDIECDNCSERILLIFKKGDRIIDKVRADKRNNGKGYYSVYLSPGPYDVTVVSNGRSAITKVRSFTRPKQHDIRITLE